MVETREERFHPLDVDTEIGYSSDIIMSQSVSKTLRHVYEVCELPVSLVNGNDKGQ